MGSLARAARKTDNKARLMELIQRDIDFSGKPKTNKEYAEEMGVSERTIIRYRGEIEREYGEDI